MFWQSKEECEYLINLARPHMKKSTVVDSKTGKSKDSTYVSLCPFLHSSWILLFIETDISLLLRTFVSVLFLSCISKAVIVLSFRVRTSSGMFLRRGQDKIIRTIEKRIADYTFIPAGMGILNIFRCIISVFSFSNVCSMTKFLFPDVTHIFMKKLKKIELRSLNLFGCV